MSLENTNDPRFERFLAREFSLPSSLRQYIRDLKAEGKFEAALKEAARLRREKVKNTFKKATVDEALVMVIDKAINSDEHEITDNFMALWLLYRKGRVTLDYIAMETRDFYARNPGFNPEIIAKVKDDAMSFPMVRQG